MGCYWWSKLLLFKKENSGHFLIKSYAASFFCFILEQFLILGTVLHQATFISNQLFFEEHTCWAVAEASILDIEGCDDRKAIKSLLEMLRLRSPNSDQASKSLVEQIVGQSGVWPFQSLQKVQQFSYPIHFLGPCLVPMIVQNWAGFFLSWLPYNWGIYGRFIVSTQMYLQCRRHEFWLNNVNQLKFLALIILPEAKGDWGFSSRLFQSSHYSTLEARQPVVHKTSAWGWRFISGERPAAWLTAAVPGQMFTK